MTNLMSHVNAFYFVTISTCFVYASCAFLVRLVPIIQDNELSNKFLNYFSGNKISNEGLYWRIQSFLTRRNMIGRLLCRSTILIILCSIIEWLDWTSWSWCFGYCCMRIIFLWLIRFPNFIWFELPGLKKLWTQIISEI